MIFSRRSTSKKSAQSRKFVLPKGNGVAIIVFVDMEIMRRPFSPLANKTAAGFFAVSLIALSGLQAADVFLHKVPPLTVEQAPLYPENLARYALGAQIQVVPNANPNAKLQLSSMSQDSNTAEAALLCDDPTVGYGLPNGATTILVSLPNIENVESLGFVNQGGRGTVSIATSNAQLPADSPQWHNAGQQELSAGSVKAKIGPVEAKYVRLTFNVSQPGRIAGFGLYSTPAVSDFTMPRPRKVAFEGKPENFALITSNLTDVHAKARALYVSSGSEAKDANKMIDNQPATSFAFAGNDANPIAVIDLGKESKLRRLSAIYTPRKGNVEFYVLKSLPVAQGENDQLKADALQKGAPAGQTPAATAATELAADVKLNDATFNNLKPVGSVASGEGDGRASVDFPETSGRYVMIRWTAAAPSQTPLAVAEIAAFGGTKTTVSQMFAANEERTGERYADGKTTFDGKTILDNKDIPAEGVEEPAEGPPPGLPQHPPFTFIPEIVPTSP